MDGLRSTCAAVAFLVAWTAGSIARAEESPPPASAAAVRTMTLDEAIAYARARQPQIRAALARVAAQKSATEVPRAQWLPVVGATAQVFGATANSSTGTYVGVPSMDLPRIGGTRTTSPGSLQPYPSTLVAAGISQEIYDFGKIAAQAAAADALVDVETQRAGGTTLSITFDVEEAYFAVLAAESIVKASNDAFERARVHRDFAKAGVDAGLRPPIELTRAEADLARLDIGRIRARGGLGAAQVTLAASVGVDDPALGAAGAPSAPPDMPALTTAMQHAAARDPRLLEAIAQLRADEERTRAIGAESRPELSVTGTVSGRAGGAQPSGNGVPSDGNGWLPYVPNWSIGIVLSWPLFDGTVKAREDASRAREQVRREDIAVVRHEQVTAIRMSYAAVDVARTALPGLQRSVDASKANYAQAEARFKAGMGTSVELADAEALRTGAEIELAMGQFDLARARAAFGRAMAEGL